MQPTLILLCVLSLSLSTVDAQEIYYQDIMQNVLRMADTDAEFQRHEHAKYGDSSDATEAEDTLQVLYDLQSTVHQYRSKKRENNKNYNAFSINGTFVKPYAVSDTCVQHVGNIIQALNANEEWAIRVVDSFGKIESGILDGNINWYGSYDECLAIRGLEFNVTNPKEIFETQYCLARTLINNLNIWVRIAVCAPESCNVSEITELMKEALSSIQPGQTVRLTVDCLPKNVKLDDRAIGAISLYGFIFLCMVVGTVFDILVVQMPQWKKNQVSVTEKVPLVDKPTPAVVQNDRAGACVYVLKLSNVERDQDWNGDTRHTPDVHYIDNTGYFVSITSLHIIDFMTGAACGAGNAFPSGAPDLTSGFNRGIFSKVLLSFSVYTNGKKLLNTDVNEGSLTAVNGIRFLSMSWVILGHCYGFIRNKSGNQYAFLVKLIDRWTFQAIANALISVDSFFTLSGLLVSYLFLRGMKKADGKMNWPMFYFHRFWRLTPAYMLVLFADVALFRHFADGPMWPKENGIERNFCNKTWWTNLLYINNIVYSDEQCMGWSWYLANDMQFFVISPILLIPLFYTRAFIGLGVCVLSLLATFITTGVISTHYDLPATTYAPGFTSQQNRDHNQLYYIKPWTRIGPYIVGIITGYLLYRTEKGFKMNKIANLLGWTIATGAAIAVLYGLYDAANGNVTLSTEVCALYNAVHRSVWGACLCWVIFSCARGYGGFVNTILSWKAFTPLSRLTYCAYLIHPLVMYTVYFSMRDLVYVTDISMVYYFFGHMVGSYAVAFVVSLAFESPMMGLEKAIFHGPKKT